VLKRDGPFVMFVEPGAASASCQLAELPPAACPTVLVGPEGGWAPEEVHFAASNGAMLVTLGSHTIRAEAMPIVALTALRVHWSDL
jgi:16S rRNA (uracil1498-N3)-methyltransferase